MRTGRRQYGSWYCALACVLCASAQAALFTQPSIRVPVGPNPSSVVALDLNGDALPEIVTADTGRLVSPDEQRPANDEVSLLIARGPLEYHKEVPLRTGFGPLCVIAANFDAQKAPDLLVANFHAARERHLSLFRNLGENRFETAGYFVVPETAITYKRALDGDGRPVFTKPALTSVIAADFNHDTFRDAIATGWASDVLVYFPGATEGYFGAPQLISADGGPRDLQAADFDKDGELDLAVTFYAAGEIGLFRGDGKGGFAPAARFPARGPLPHSLRIADMNNDSRPDLVVSHCHATDAVVIYYGDGGFEFSVAQEISLGKDHAALEQEIRGIAVEDLNFDGAPDIVAACSLSQQVKVILNYASQGVRPRNFSIETYTFSSGRPNAVALADLNQDGAKDIVVALHRANAVEFLLNTARPPKPEPPPKPVPPSKPAKKKAGADSR